MGPGLFRDEPGSDREPVDHGGGFRIDPADRPFASSQPDRAPDSWTPNAWTPGERGPLRVGLIRLGLAVLFMAVAAGGLWMAYSKGRSAGAGGGVPLIKADQTAMKAKPDNPGGITEDGDTPVYSVNAGGGAKVEQLLPGPELPMTKPQPVSEPSPPPAVAGVAPTVAPGPTASSPSTSVTPTPVTATPATTTPSQATLAPVAAPPIEPAPTAEASPPPAPIVAPPKPAPPPAKAPPQVAAAGSGALRIQIAATKDIASAHKEWARLKAAHMDVLGDLKAFGVRVDLGERGVFYRIQAGPIDNRGDAMKRCAVLKQSGIGCIIVKQP